MNNFLFESDQECGRRVGWGEERDHAGGTVLDGKFVEFVDSTDSNLLTCAR